jgi:3-(3-hydroxy-phenyl)propionate hydroxylase
MGMNSGVQDAVSAARRLADHLGGRADESVLDEYDRNRRRVAIEYVGADSHKNWQVLREPDPAERQRYQAELKAEAADPVRARQRLLRTAMLDAVRESL